MTEFEIEYPTTKAGKRLWAKEYGMNSIYAGKHWAKRQKDKQFWHALIQAKMQAAGIEKKPFDKPVSISFWWDDRLDLDNTAYMRKMIIDALKGWIIYDDTKRYVRELHDYCHNEGFIKIRVEGLNEEHAHIKRTKDKGCIE